MIAAAIGSPINVLKSNLSNALLRSPIILTTRMSIAMRVPQRVPRHKPTAAIRHAVPTKSMIPIDHPPIARNAECASGLSRHSESSAVPGKSSNAIVKTHMLAPNAKNDASQ